MTNQEADRWKQCVKLELFQIDDEVPHSRQAASCSIRKTVIMDFKPGTSIQFDLWSWHYLSHLLRPIDERGIWCPWPQQLLLVLLAIAVVVVCVGVVERNCNNHPDRQTDGWMDGRTDSGVEQSFPLAAQLLEPIQTEQNRKKKPSQE